MSLIGNLEGAGPGNLCIRLHVGIVVGDEVAVEVIRKVRRGDLVAHRDRTGDAFSDGSRNYRQLCVRTREDDLECGNLPLLKYSMYFASSWRVFQPCCLQFWHVSMTKITSSPF